MIIYYTPTAGDTIQHAAETAVQKAYDSLHTIHFAFNGIALVAKPSLTHSEDADRIVTEYFQALAKSAQTYSESPEGVHEQQDSQTRVTAAQAKIDDLFARLADISEDGLPQLLDWLVEYAEAADVRGVKSYPSTVVYLLTEVGFKRNENTGLEDGAYESRNVFGRYIVGQVIDGLYRGRVLDRVISHAVTDFHTLSKP